MVSHPLKDSQILVTVRFTVIWSPHFSFFGLFSTVSTPMFATKASFFSVFQLSYVFCFSRIAFKRNPGKDEKKKILAYFTVGEKSLLLFADSWALSSDRESSARLAAVVERDTPPGRVPAFETSLSCFLFLQTSARRGALPKNVSKSSLKTADENEAHKHLPAQQATTTSTEMKDDQLGASAGAFAASIFKISQCFHQDVDDIFIKIEK